MKNERPHVRFAVSSLSKHFKGHSIGPFNFSIYENEICAMVGETGSGKSTVAKILMGLMSASEGGIRYKDVPLIDYPRRMFRRENQMMFQNHLLAVNPHFSIRQILSEPLKVEEISKADIRERMGYFLDLFELPDFLLGKKPDALSGGELQRVLFIRSLVLYPEFVVLDEPFSNVSKRMARRLIEKIQAFRQGHPCGMLLISHHPEYVAEFAERVMEMSGQGIVEAENVY